MSVAEDLWEDERLEDRMPAPPRGSGPAPGRRRALVALLGAIALIIGLVAFGASKGSDSFRSQDGIGSGGAVVSSGSGTTTGASSAGGTSTGASTAGVAGSPESGATRAAAPTASPTAPAPLVPNQVPSPDTKVVKTGSLTLQVKHGLIATTLGALTNLVTGFGGFVAASNMSDPGGTGAQQADITVRVPVGSFEKLLGQARGLGTDLGVQVSGQDVTAQYVDLSARLQSLIDTRTQFQQILAKATTIGDILSVEAQLSNLQTQVEQLQGQKRVMDDQTSYSTLAIHLQEPGFVAQPIRPSSGGVGLAWAHARHSFASGIESILAWSGGFAVFLIVSAGLGAAAWLAWKVSNRVRRTRSTAP